MSEAAPVQRITRATPAGFEAAGSAKTVTSYRTWQFSGGWPPGDGWPAKNIHTDLEFARACGLPVRAASGAMPLGYLADLMADLFGDGWLSRGRIEAKFVRLVGVDDTIMARAHVRSIERERDGTRFELDLWCENQSGEKVVVGSGVGWKD